MTEKKIEKEIEYWSKHLDLDKLNISIAIDKSNHILLLLLSLLTIIITSLPFIFQFLNAFLIRILIVFIFILIVGILWKSRDKKSKEEIKDHNLSFIIRERMLQERYKRLYGLSKEELNTEFENLKNIYKNPEAHLIELLIKEYYKNKLNKK